MAQKWHHDGLAAHTEFTRLLSEHGTVGMIFMIVIFVIIPIGIIQRMDDDSLLLFFVGFYCLSLLTMFHSAMRLALPGVLYGLSLLIYKKTKE